MGEPDQEKWLQDKMVGLVVANVECDEFGQILITMVNGTRIAFTAEADEPGLTFIDAYEV